MAALGATSARPAAPPEVETGTGSRRGFVAGDPLRAIAALAVLGSHVVQFASFGYGVPLRAIYGHIPSVILGNLDLGLYIFFVLSGYLVGRPFVRAFIDGHQSPPVAPYARNRLLRIVPAYWLVFTAILILLGTRHSSVSQIGAVYLFGQVWDTSGASALIEQAWTLQVELLFYLALPLAAYFIARAFGSRLGRHGRLRLTAVLLLCVYVLSVLLQQFLPADNVLGSRCVCGPYLRSMPAMLFAFVPGLALGALESAIPRAWLTDRRARRWSIIAIPAALAIIVLYLATSLDLLGVRAVFSSLAAGLLVAGPLVWEWSNERPWRLLDNAVLQWIGRRSYSLYLVHVAVISEVITLMGPAGGPWHRLAILALASSVVSLVLAAVSYRLFERPFLALRARRRVALPAGSDPAVGEA